MFGFIRELRERPIHDALGLLLYYRHRAGDGWLLNHNHDTAAADLGVSIASINRWHRTLFERGFIAVTLLHTGTKPTLAVSLTLVGMCFLGLSPTLDDDDTHTRQKPPPLRPRPCPAPPHHGADQPITTVMNAPAAACVVPTPPMARTDAGGVLFTPVASITGAIDTGEGRAGGRVTARTGAGGGDAPITDAGQPATDHDHVLILREIPKEDRREDHDRVGGHKKAAGVREHPMRPEYAKTENSTSSIPPNAPKAEDRADMSDDTRTFVRRQERAARLGAEAGLAEVLGVWFESQKVAQTLMSAPHARDLLGGCACRFRALTRWVEANATQSKCGLVWCLVMGKNRWGRQYPIFPTLMAALSDVACGCGVAGHRMGSAPPDRRAAAPPPDQPAAPHVALSSAPSARQTFAALPDPDPVRGVAPSATIGVTGDLWPEARAWLPAMVRQQVKEVRQDGGTVRVVARIGAMTQWLKSQNWTAFLSHIHAHTNRTMVLVISP